MNSRFHKTSTLGPFLLGLSVALVATQMSFADLAHRWSFSETGGSGTTLADSIGSADATIVEIGANNADVGTSYAGQVYLAGGAKGSSDYVELPDGTISALAGDATFELWATTHGVQNWSRILSFGSGTADNFRMAFTRGTDTNTDHLAWTDTGVGGDNNKQVDNTMYPYALGTQYHIVVTFDVDGTGPTTKTIARWYKDGVYRGMLDTDCKLSDLTDTENALGRSKWGDNTANASYNELRIYNHALTAEEVARNTTLGPDVPPPVNSSAEPIYTTQAILSGLLFATNGPTYLTAYWGQIDGGTNKGDVANALRYEYHDNVGGADLTLDDGVANGRNGGLFLRVPTEEYNWTGEVWQGGNYSDSYCKMWWGYFTPPLTGDYVFYVHGDDNEVLWIDNNRNGEFEEAEGELVSDSRPPEGWNTPHTETNSLTAGVKYLVAMAFVEGTGGDFFNITITKPGGTAEHINPSNPAQSGWWSIPGWTNSAALGQSAVGALNKTITGLASEQEYYFTYYASNTTWDVWADAPDTFGTPLPGIWNAAVSRLWGSVSNWSHLNVPDTESEYALFNDTAVGDVLLGGSDFTAGAVTLSAGGYTLADTNASPGSLTLNVLTNSSGQNTIDAEVTVTGLVDVTGGGLRLTASPDFTAAEIDLDGASLTIVGEGETVDRLHEWYFEGNWGDQYIDPIDTGDGFRTRIPGAITLLDTALNFGGATMNTRSGGLVGTDSIGALWWGKIVIGTVGSGHPLEAGEVTFGTATDDGSTFWVDLDRDGVFEHAGDNGDEMVVNNKGGHGVLNRVGTRTLEAGEYLVAIGFYEGGGGEHAEARFAQGTVAEAAYGTMSYVDPSLQVGLWKAPDVQPTTLANSPITVSGGGAIVTPGTVAVASDVDVAAAQTLHKGELGTLITSGDVDLSAGSTLQVDRGVLAVEGGLTGTGSIVLNGGSVRLSGSETILSNRLNYAFYDNAPVSYLTGIDDGVINGMNGGPFRGVATSSSEWTGEVWQGGNVSDTYVQMWWGYFRAPSSGTYTFYLHGDDYEILWIDVNQNGEFEEVNGEDICRNVSGTWNDPRTETVDLVGGGIYAFAMVHNEGGGGDFVNFEITIPGGAAQRINPSDAGQDGWWFIKSHAARDASSVALNITSDAGLSSDGASSLGDLTVSSGVDILIGGDVTVDSVPSSGGNFTINAPDTLTVTGPIGAETILAYGNFSADGTITIGTKLGLEPTLTVSNLIEGTGEVWLGENRRANGYVELTANNTYSGATYIRRAQLRAGIGTGLPNASCLRFTSYGDDEYAVLETSGSLSRNVGTGAGEVYWDTRGGFSALGGPLSVTLNSGASIDWGAAGGFNNQRLQLNAPSADNAVEITNPIDLGSAERHIFTWDNANSQDDVAILSGNLSGTGGGGTYLRKWRNGTLWLRGTNTYEQQTFLDDGIIRIDGQDSLSPNTCFIFDQSNTGGHGILEGKGVLTFNVGPAGEAGAFSWDWQNGGFAAYGGPFTITLEGGVQLCWTNATEGFDGHYLQLGSRTANDVVELTNPIEIGNGSRRYIRVFDNAESSNDVARLSGVISGTNTAYELWKLTDGVLELTGNNIHASPFVIDTGVVRMQDGVGASPNAAIVFDEGNSTIPCIWESQGSITRDVGPMNQANAVSWDWQNGGFAAFGGPLAVNLEGGLQLTSQGNPDLGFDNHVLQLGSRTANDVVDFQNDILLTNDYFEVRVFENTNTSRDESHLSGAISFYGWGDMGVRGDGVLRLTAPTNTIRQFRIYDTATVLFNGYHNGTDYVYTEANQAGTVGGTGSVFVWNYMDIRNLGNLAPGDDDVGTLDVEVFQSGANNDLELQNGSTYAWELGGLTNDIVNVTGHLRLTSGWKLKLRDGGGGLPLASREYTLFTYSGTMHDYTDPVIDESDMPAEWVTSGMTVVHDAVNRRVYLTGLFSTLSIGNEAPSNLTDASARLNGILSSSGQVLHVWAYWGETDEGTDSGAWDHEVYVRAYTNVLAQPVFCSIGSLVSNGGYYYTFRATNATQNLWATPSVSFNALGAPIVENNGVIDVAAGSATLRGRFLDHNRATVTVCWGLTDGGTASIDDWEYTSNIGLQAFESFAATVSQVYYPQSYVYRCYAENAYGSDWSDSTTAFSVTVKPETTYPLSGLVGRWTFDESTAEDSSGNDHHGQRIGGSYSNDVPAVLAGGKSIDLRGGDYFVKVDTGGSQDVFDLDDISISCWTKGWPVGANWQPWVAKGGEGGQGYQFRRYSSTADGVSWTLRGPGNDDWYVSHNINDGAWHHMVATYGEGRRRIYADNVLVAEEVRFGPINDDDDMLTFGALQVAGVFQRYARMQLDDILIYDRPITPTEINQLYSNVITTALSIDNSQVTDVDLTTATLNARLSAPDAVYDVDVFWGLTDETNDWSSWTSNAFVGTFTDTVATVSFPATGFVPGNTYFYTFRATNTHDVMYASPSTNFAPVTQPVVTNAPGALAAVGGATLRGTLTEGNYADVTIYWGREDKGESHTGWDGALVLNDVDNGMFETNIVAGHGITYYYRCYATNAAGEDWAAYTTNFMTTIPSYDPQMNVTSGLLYRLAADEITGLSDDDPLDSWDDVSGNERDFFKSTDGQRPLYKTGIVNSLPAIRFDGADDQLLMGQPTAPETVFIVNQVVSAANAEGIWGSTNPGDRGIRMLDASNWRGLDNGDGNDYSYGTGGQSYVNGTWGRDYGGLDSWHILMQARADTHSSPYNVTAIGMYYGGRPLDGDIAEVLAYDRDLSADEKDKVGGYLTEKYGLTTAYGEAEKNILAITNLAVTAITTNSAQMNGALYATGWVFEVFAFWGTNNGGTVTGDWENSASMGVYTNFDGSLTRPLTSLFQGSNYWYSFMATNEVTNMWATPTIAFGTKAPPTVDNLDVANLTARSAFLRGDLRIGGTADATIYWGLTDGGSSPGTWQNTNELGEVVTGAPFAMRANLLAGGHYYYTTYATNDLGEDWADSAADFYATVAPTVPSYVSGLREWYFEGTFSDSQLDVIDSGSGFLTMAPGATNKLDVALSFAGADMNIRSLGLVGVDTIGAAWWGAVSIGTVGSGDPLEAGAVTFGTASDDGTVFWVDLDQDGVFEHDGDDGDEMVVNNKGNHGVVNRVGTRTLTSGLYNIAIGFFEGAGGEFAEARYAQGTVAQGDYGTMTIVNPGDAGQAGLWYYDQGGTNLTPVLVNDVVTDLTTTSATMNATMDATNFAYEVYALWGTNDGLQVFGDWEYSQSMGLYANYNGTHTLPLSGLLPGTNYWYTWYATNAVTNLWGTPSVYFQPYSPPRVETQPASDVLARSATLNGRLVLGGVCGVTLYYGLHDAGQTSTGWAYTNALGNASVGLFGTNVSLYAGGTYYYRFHATNALGTDWSDTVGVVATLAHPAEYHAGLLGGSAVGNMYFGVNPETDVYLGPHCTTSQASPPWAGNLTWVYGGQIYLNGGTHHFCENIDDKTRMVIDGATYIDDAVWGTPAKSGPINKTAGWYDIDLRFSNGGGGAGPVANNAWTATKGFGYNIDGLDSNQGWAYEYPEDPGDATLFRHYIGEVGFGLTNMPVTSVWTNTATFNATLSATGWAFTVYACYGTNDAGTVFEDWEHTEVAAYVENHDDSLSYEATGLSSGTNYWYTFFVTNAVTHAWAAPSIPFQTLSTPQIENVAASGISTTEATLNADLVQGGECEVTAYWGLTDGGTTAGAWDFSTSLGTVPAGSLTTNVAVRAAGKYYFRWYASNMLGEDWSDTAGVFYSQTGTVSIADASVTEGHPGDTPTMQFTVSLSDVTAVDVDVNYTTSDGTAVGGTDYAAETATLLTISAGSTSGQATVSVAGDRIYECGPETFAVTLSLPVGATIGDGTATGSIVDDDIDVELAGYDYKMKITFSGYTGSETLTNFPALVKLSESIPGFRYSDFTSADGFDLRFVPADFSGTCNFEIERWDATGDSVVWVQVPELSGTDTYIWVYWGNPDARTTVLSNPAHVDGCLLWLDANDIDGDGCAEGTTEFGLSGSQVDTWVDKSGNGHTATRANGSPHYVTSAINGKPVIRFDGQDDHFTFSSVTGIRTIFWVIKEDSDATENWRPLLSGEDGPSDQNYHRGAGKTFWDARWAAPEVYNGTTYVNGTSVGNGQATVVPTTMSIVALETTGDTQANKLGIDRGSTARVWDGDYAEVIIYNRILSASERDLVGHYLEQKYALATTYGTPAQFVNTPDSCLDGSTWSQDYEAVWHFADNVEDSTTRYTATEQGTPTYSLAPAMVGKAIDLDGASDWVDVSDGFANFTGGITVESWVRTEANANWARVIDFGNGSGVNNILLARSGTSDDVNWTFYGTAGGTESMTVGSQFVGNTWQHLAATCSEGGANTAVQRIYRDGIERANKTDSSPPPNVTRVNNYIGDSNWGGDAFFDGQMDELRISTVERTADWIGAVHKNMADTAAFNAYGAVQVRPPTLFIVK